MLATLFHIFDHHRMAMKMPSKWKPKIYFSFLISVENSEETSLIRQIISEIISTESRKNLLKVTIQIFIWWYPTEIKHFTILTEMNLKTIVDFITDNNYCGKTIDQSTLESTPRTNVVKMFIAIRIHSTSFFPSYR